MWAPGCQGPGQGRAEPRKGLDRRTLPKVEPTKPTLIRKKLQENLEKD